MMNTTFEWEDEDNIGTYHDVLLFGDQHETFGTTVMLYEVMKSNRSLVHDREYVSHDNTLGVRSCICGHGS